MSQTAQWTWLVYMAGDNNLEGAGRDDLAEMKQVGSTADVNVIVQFDTEKNRTTRYRIEKNRLKILQQMPGVDCGDPKVLTQFIRWGTQNYPAQHYLLDIWSHGTGWEHLPSDFDYATIRRPKPVAAAKRNRVKRALFRTTVQKLHTRPAHSLAFAIDIAVDSTSQDALDTQELRRGIVKALPKGRKLDILGCDACLMNMLEIAYELRDTATFMVGSEDAEPATGWPYAAILKRLMAAPTMSPAEVARTIVTEYGKDYRKRHATATQSALDLGHAQAAAAAVNALADALLADLHNLAGVAVLARDRAQKFTMPEYIDLGDFATQLAERLPQHAAVKAATDKVQQALQPASGPGLVLQNAVCGSKVEHARGVSIYFPHAENYGLAYADLAFSKGGRWQSFLQALFKA